MVPQQEALAPSQPERHPDALPSESRRPDRLIERINRDYVVLLSLPWLIFLINPNWLFQGFGHMDPWYYFGMSIDYPLHQHVSLSYPGERLTWILPSRLVIALFGPIYGWIVFHLCVYWISAFSLYALMRRFAGARTALVTTLMLAVNPLFIGSNGWSYVDSGSIAYFLLTLLAITAAHRARDAWPYLILAGALWAATAYNYLLWWVLTPCCLLFYWATEDPKSRQISTLRRYAAATASFLAGIALATLLMATCHYLIYGAVARGFYAEHLGAAAFNLGVTGQQVTWGQQDYSWIKIGGWIVFPVVAFLAGIVALIRHYVFGHHLNRLSLGLIASYGYTFLVLVYFTFRPNQVLQFDYYASILMPLEFLVLGVIVFATPSLSGRYFAAVLAAAVAISLAPLWHVTFYQPGSEKNLLWHYVVALAVIIIVTFWRATPAWALGPIGLAIVSFGLVPRYPSNAWHDVYNGMSEFQRLADAVRCIDANTSPDKLPVLWIDNLHSHDTAEYRAIMCALQVHNISMKTYPEAEPPVKYPAGTELVIVTPEKNIFARANAVATKAGFPLALRKQVLISGEGVQVNQRTSYWLTFADVIPTNEAVSAAATFIKVDATTKGNWNSVYGSDAVVIPGDVPSYPQYASVILTGEGAHVWAPSTDDPRAVARTGGSERTAAAWYTSTSFTFDINLVDGKNHEVALYCLDWDTNGTRKQRIEVIRVADDEILDTRTVSSFQGGQYLVWSLKGHVQVRVTLLSGANAIASAILFSTPPAGTPDAGRPKPSGR